MAQSVKSGRKKIIYKKESGMSHGALKVTGRSTVSGWHRLPLRPLYKQAAGDRKNRAPASEYPPSSPASKTFMIKDVSVTDLKSFRVFGFDTGRQ